MERPRVLVSTVGVGEGNPASAQAIFNLLPTSIQRNSRISTTTVSALPPRALHMIMTHIPALSREYGQSEDALRSGLGAQALGYMMAAEMLTRNPNLLFGIGNSFDVGIFTQEHQLSTLSEAHTRKLFPRGVYLVIPDVIGTESARFIVRRNKAITPVVWSHDARAELEQQGIKAVVTAPFLLDGFCPPPTLLASTARDVVIKASGSGIPRQYASALSAGLKRNSCGVDLYNGGGGYSTFYRDLLSHPPHVLISYPSEVIQVVADLRRRGWDGYHFSLPPRGKRERVNLMMAHEVGLSEGVLFDSVAGVPTRELDEVIAVTQNMTPNPSWENFLIGGTPFYEAVSEHMEAAQ